MAKLISCLLPCVIAIVVYTTPVIGAGGWALAVLCVLFRHPWLYGGFRLECVRNGSSYHTRRTRGITGKK